MNKTPQIAEEKLVMTMDKAREKKLQRYKISVSVFSADISKGEEISRWRPIDKTLHYDLAATETFFKNRHNCLSEGLTFFIAMGSKRSEIKHSPRLRGNRHTNTQTHTQTDCYNPPSTLGLISIGINNNHQGAQGGEGLRNLSC